MNNETNHRRGDVVLLCESALLPASASVCGANISDVIGREFTATIGDPSMIATPAFGLPINSVVEASAGPQMSRIAAPRVIAKMKNKWPIFRNRAVSEEVGDAVCERRVAPLAALTDAVCTIARAVARCLPFPAGVRAAGAIQLSPETIFLYWGNINSHVSLLTDVPRRRVFSAPLRLSVLSPQLYQMVTR